LCNLSALLLYMLHHSKMPKANDFKPAIDIHVFEFDINNFLWFANDSSILSSFVLFEKTILELFL
jgi:hypothetical protein